MKAHPATTNAALSSARLKGLEPAADVEAMATYASVWAETEGKKNASLSLNDLDGVIWREPQFQHRISNSSFGFDDFMVVAWATFQPLND